MILNPAYYARLARKRVADRIEVMRVRGVVAKYFRDPERWSRYFGYVFLPGCFILVQCCYFFFQTRIVGEIEGREKREKVYSARRLTLGGTGSSSSSISEGDGSRQ